MKTKSTITILLLAAVLSSCALLGVSGKNTSSGSGTLPTIHIGYKNFAEEEIIGNLFKGVLEHAGYSTTMKGYDTTKEINQALVNGDIDTYAEYLGTAFVVLEGNTYDTSMTETDIYNKVKATYSQQDKVAALDLSSFDDGYVLVMQTLKATNAGVSTLTDLSSAASNMTLGAEQAFLTRPDGLPGLQSAYGGFNFAQTVPLDHSKIYQQLLNGSVDVVAGFGTDGEIIHDNLTVIKDDAHFWPPYPVMPLIAQSILDAHPDIKSLLNSVVGKLDSTTMRNLNWQVTGEGKTPADVAHNFLVRQNLVQ